MDSKRHHIRPSWHRVGLEVYEVIFTTANKKGKNGDVDIEILSTRGVEVYESNA